MIGFYIGTKSEKKRDAFNTLITALEFILIIMLFPEIKDGPIEYVMPNIMGTGIHLKVDLLRYSMLFISGLAWFLTTMYSTQYLIRRKSRNRYYLFFMLTYATTLGVFMSENIINLFTFFEGMSLASYILVIHDEDRYSIEAGKSYLFMAIAGGLVMLFGIFLAFDYTKTLDITEMGQILPHVGNVKYLIAGLIMSGFAVKASVFPLHTWLPKAYPAAPTPATALLSGILLKTGLFGIIIVLVELMHFDSKIAMVIYVLGIINIFLGGILAMMQRNVKRIIAYSSLSQTGFMLMGIGLIGILGEEGGLALTGTVLYMINHALFKLLLFMGTGIIYMILNELSINIIRGFGREKWKLKIIFLIGMCGLIGVPGFNGFTSKTLVHEAILEAYHLTHNPFFKVTEYLFLIGGALTVAYMLKLFIALFVSKNPEFRGQYKEHVSKRALLPMGILAGLIIFVGIFPMTIIDPFLEYSKNMGLHVPKHLHVFTLETIGYSVFSLVVGTLIYLFYIRKNLLIKRNDTEVYINPSLQWIRLEEDILAPVVRFIYKYSSIVFKFIDSWTIITVTRIANLFKYIANMDSTLIVKMEWDRMIVDTSKDSFEHEIEGKLGMYKEEIKEGASEKIASIKNTKDEFIKKDRSKVKEVIAFIHNRATSITYSVFLLGFVLVFSLLFIFAVS